MTNRRLGLLRAAATVTLALLALPSTADAGVGPKFSLRYHWPYLRKRVEVPLNHEFGYTPTFWRRWDEDPEMPLSPPEMMIQETEVVPGREESLPAPGETTEPGVDESTEPTEEGTSPDESMLPGGAEPELPALPTEEPSFPVEEMPGELPAEPEQPAAPEGETAPTEETEPAPAPETTPEGEQPLPPPETPFENPEPPTAAPEEPSATPPDAAAPSTTPETGRQAQRMDAMEEPQAAADAFTFPASHAAELTADADAGSEIDWPDPNEDEEARPASADQLSEVGLGFSRARTTPTGDLPENAIHDEPSTSQVKWATPRHPPATADSSPRALSILDGPQLQTEEALPDEQSLPVSATDQPGAGAASQWRAGSPRPMVNESRQWSRPSATRTSGANRGSSSTSAVPLSERGGQSRRTYYPGSNRPLPMQSTQTQRRTSDSHSEEIQMGRVAPASYYEKAKPRKTKQGGLFGGLLGLGK
ncbi:MAG: hypothetical protein K2Y37_08015 [Pirellulales bacterium]|nr:hypothetical protein [Pirellulales bacterium]